MNRDILEESSAIVMSELPDIHPSCALVLGSGWGDVVEAFTIMHSIDFADVPCLGSTSVTGHAGKIIVLKAHDKELLVFQGRRHFYEGDGWDPVIFPVYLCKALAVPQIILTNAAGAVNTGYKPGDLMLISDHINAIGSNPLIGDHDSALGPRFPDQSEVYDKKLRDLFTDTASECDLPIHEGIYIATSGPTYETPAEIDAFRNMGADAVGMSTVPEAILANSAGMAVAGISCITNLAAGISKTKLSHEEVIAETNKAKPGMVKLLSAIINELCRND